MVTVKQILSRKENYGGARDKGAIRYLVYHYTANKGDTAENNGNYFARTVTKSSAHYFVDEDSVVQSVPDLCVAWSVGGGLQGTGGGTMHGVVTNTNSLSIEMCDSYDAVPEATAALALSLGRELMEKYNIPMENVYRHYDVTGKVCPRPLVQEAAWAAFRNRLKGEEEEMTQAQFDAMMADYLSRRAAKEPGGWSDDAREWAEKAGIIQGTGEGKMAYQSFVTREQLVEMLDRQANSKA